MIKTVVEDSWAKVFVGGLPSDWTDDQVGLLAGCGGDASGVWCQLLWMQPLVVGQATNQPTASSPTNCPALTNRLRSHQPHQKQVKDILKPYGQLKSFNLVMDKATGKSKGYCFCEFDDDAAIDGVIAGLHMKNLNRKLLTVKRALDGIPPNRTYSGGSDGGNGSGGMGSRRGSGVMLLGAQPGAFGRANSGGSGGGAGLYGPPPGGLPQHPGAYGMGMPVQLPVGIPGGPPPPGWRGNALAHGAPLPSQPGHPGVPHGGMPGAVFGLGPPPPGAGGPPAAANSGAGAGGPRPAPIQPPPVLKKVSSGGSGAGAAGGEAGAAAAGAGAGAGAAPAAAASAPRESEAGDAVGGPLPAIASLPGGVVSAVAW
jgi:hypothetical protein